MLEGKNLFIISLSDRIDYHSLTNILTVLIFWIYVLKGDAQAIFLRIYHNYWLFKFFFFKDRIYFKHVSKYSIH